MNCLDPPCSPFFQIVGYEVGWYLVVKDFLHCLFKVFSLLVLVQIFHFKNVYFFLNIMIGLTHEYCAPYPVLCM